MLLSEKKRLVSFILVFIFLFTSMLPSKSYASGLERLVDEEVFRSLLREEDEKNSIKLNPIHNDREVTLIITLKEKAVKDYSNLALEDLAKDDKLVAKVLKSQEKYIKEIKKINKDIQLGHRYYLTINGFSLQAKYRDIEKIKEIPGISDLSEAEVYYKDMASVNKESGIDQIQLDYGYTGEGKLVAVLDSGIDYEHRDMRLDQNAKKKLDEKKVEELKNKKGIKRGKYFSDKIPFGYNYADKNNDIKDRVKSNVDYGHGMHVAGIIGGNTEKPQFIEENKGIKGVAPNSQLLAMKIFSNDENKKGASEADIIMALEDAIALGTDVINMSFCMSAGFQDPSEGQQQTIRTAVENGIVVVAAAGNAAYSTFPKFYDDSLDIGTVGSPGLAKETIQVGSYENSNMITFAMNLKSEEVEESIPYVLSDHDPSVLEGYYELVDCGLGKEEEIKDLNLKGKIGLVKRGELDFEDKKLNIQKKGAKAVIIYNKDGDENFLPFISTHKDVRVPTVFTNSSNGKKLLAASKSKGKIKFTTKPMSIPNYNKEEMSMFSSWGPTPNLDLKPDLVATGGNIWSTVNDNQYKNMSGTSMATPLTSGIVVLMLEHIEKLGLEFTTSQEKVNYIKTLLMNTAKIKTDKENKPYSPRLQGAGLVDLSSSLKNQVLLSYESHPSISLGQIDANKTISLDLRNMGDKSKVYNIEVLSDSFNSDINGKELELEPKSTIKVKLSITPKKGLSKDNYLEGFIVFRSQDKLGQDLSIPLLAFYGDWGALDMFDSLDKEKSIYKHTGLYTTENDGFVTSTLPLGGKDNNPDFYAINPEDPKSYNNVLPSFSLLRNAKKLAINVTNEAGDIIKIIEDKENVRKEVSWEQEIKAKVNFDWLWGGTVYDKNLGIQRPLDEGQYYIDIEVKPDFSQANQQTITMPIKIDKTAPSVKVRDFMTEEDNCDIEIQALDKGKVNSGIKSFVFILNGKKYTKDGGPVFHLKGEDNIYSHNIKLDKKPLNTVDIGVTDHANNMTGERFFIISSKYSNIDLTKIEDEYKSGELSFEYSLESDEAIKYELSLDSLDNIIYQGNAKEFSLDKPILDGSHRLIVKALDKNGKLVDISFKDFKVSEGIAKEGLNIEASIDKTSIKRGNYCSGSLRVSNNTSEDKNICLVLGIYDQDKEMIDVAVSEKNISKGKSSSLSSNIMIPDSGNYTLNLMVWDSLEEMNSLISPIEIQIE